MKFSVDSNHNYVTLEHIWPFNHIRQVAPHSQLAGAVSDVAIIRRRLPSFDLITLYVNMSCVFLLFTSRPK